MDIYQIDYIGCDGQEVSTTHQGDAASLAVEITWIEERGGWGISVEDEAGEIVYGDGGFTAIDKGLPQDLGLSASRPETDGCTPN